MRCIARVFQFSETLCSFVHTDVMDKSTKKGFLLLKIFYKHTPQALIQRILPGADTDPTPRHHFLKALHIPAKPSSSDRHSRICLIPQQP